ncbi:S26 family signal peptidase [Streptomyces johnsoniae]|uniref:S26 family signal peptidase n=1 Tax=Streptomyces johnsoniae TaxID=3075532 RepID=A0ABU2S364_9ACTN|nr:S26 family signal peptidase [Streptomyces sp. DSM 41886]MDT0443439.1 S26 family signal peptidase [Streptomyces sp. DSM 41886]
MLGIGGTAVWWLRRSYRIVTVLGRSMWPTFHDGEVVVARRRSARRLRVGDVVILTAPEPKGILTVKRVAALPGDPVPEAVVRAAAGSATTGPMGGPVPQGHLIVLGDNPDLSVDSRQHGPRPLGDVRGVVLRPVRTPRRRLPERG